MCVQKTDMKKDDLNIITDYMQTINKIGVFKSFYYFAPLATWVILVILIVKLVSKYLGI